MSTARDEDRPSVYDHLDHRAYLNAWFRWKQLKNPRYSHRLFTQQTKISNPNLLLLVIQGKQIQNSNPDTGFIHTT